MSKKIFKTLDEQIEILRAKGLVINNDEYAKNVLLKENYFFISGYRQVFFKPEKKEFLDNTTFEELYCLFKYDRKLRNIFFKNLLIIENNIKSVFSYQLSKKYGYMEKDYLNVTNFDYTAENKRKINDLIKKVNRQVRVNGKNHAATMHYINSYGYVPLWVTVKVISFGIICEMFSILKYEDKKEISDIYGINPQLLELFLPILSNYRNLCAHEDILFDRRSQKEIVDTKYHNLLTIPLINGEYIYGKDDLFAIVIILKYLLSNKEFSLFITEISMISKELAENLQVINIDKIYDVMGFPKNYMELVGM